MATKPTDLPRWGTDQTNETEPSSGQKDSGWTNGQTAVSAYENWLKRTIYEWIDYLNDGDLEGDITVSDASANLRFEVDHAGEAINMYGDVTIEDGTASGSLTVVNGDVAIQAGTLDVFGNATASDFRHTATRTKVVYPSMGVATGGSPSVGSLGWTLALGDIVSFDIDLEDGDQLDAVRAAVEDDGSDTISLFVRRITATNGSSTDTGVGSATSSGGGTLETIAATGLAETIDHNSYRNSYRVWFGVSGGTGHRIKGLYIDYTRP